MEEFRFAFQIADDALDYYAKEKFFAKKLEKIFMRKVTLPLITIFQREMKRGIFNRNNEKEKELRKILVKH